MRFSRSGSRIIAAGALLPLSAGATVAGAHEKWFVSGDTPALSRSGFLTAYSLSAAALAAAVTLVAWFVWRRRRRRDLAPGPEWLGATEEGMTRLFALAPVILGVHFAVPLLVLGVQGRLFSPNNQPATPWNLFIGTWEIAVALGLLTEA